MLGGKKILLGICGSIAAYKTAEIIRLLIKAEAEVQVITSASASAFITPLTLSTLSKRPVYSDFVKDDFGQWTNHVELGLWADAFLIAPATANTIGKCANGLCDNLLTATYLSSRAPVFFAPAMDLDMYQHPSVIQNISKLEGFGNVVLNAPYGELASGLTGKGRMMEPEDIFSFLTNHFSKKQRLLGKKVLVTAGPTYEPIDPVRFIGNRSTGKMGYAVAEKLKEEGAEVFLVSGPTSLEVPKGIRVIKVEQTSEMYEASIKLYPEMDIAVLAAAVADYKPQNPYTEKIKKTSDNLNLALDLVKTSDIAAQLGKMKTASQLLVGFALETENEIENAQKKIKSKNLDFIILNSLKDAGAGFSVDTNKICILDKYTNIKYYELKSKKDVAADIVDAICKFEI